MQGSGFIASLRDSRGKCRTHGKEPLTGSERGEAKGASERG